MADAITRARLLKVTNYRGSAIVTVTIRTVQLYDCLRPRKSLPLSLEIHFDHTVRLLSRGPARALVITKLNNRSSGMFRKFNINLITPAVRGHVLTINYNYSHLRI